MAHKEPIDASGVAEPAPSESTEDDSPLDLLLAHDEESMSLLALWLKENATTFAPVVIQAAHQKPGLSPEASCAVLDAMFKKAPADDETMMKLMSECLRVITSRITASIDAESAGDDHRHDDPLVGPAVAVVAAGRRSNLSEAAVNCLAKQGLGGALVLVRAFDSVRDTLKLYVVRRLKPAVVWDLGENEVASLANSVSKLAEGLEGKQNAAALKFLAALAPDEHSSSAEINPTDPLETGEYVFHASWGTGNVLKVSDETITIDFGCYGKRTLLRKLATLRHAV